MTWNVSVARASRPLNDLFRRRRAVRLALTACVITTAAISALPGATAQPRPITGPISVADWANQVWTSAQAGQKDRMFTLFEALPSEHEVAEIVSLREKIDQRDKHLEAAQADRLSRLDEAWTELDEKLAKDDLSDSLRTAVEISSLSDDKAGVMANPKIADLADRAEREARHADAAGEWLKAQELYFRLNLLYEDTQRFESDLARVGSRLMMIRLYAPERLHDMRDAERAAEGLDPLPPFNKVGEDWHQKLAGIEDPNLVVRALQHAQLAHVDGADMGDMLAGAIDNVKTLATTPEVASSFPNLKDEDKKAAFVAELGRVSKKLEERRGRVDVYDLTRTIRSVLDANTSTVAIDPPALLHEFGNGAMSKLDQFSGIVWPDELRQFQRTTQGRFTGVGIQIQLDEAQRLKVVTPLNGTPAHRAGILPGDIITQVDDESTIGITLTGAVERITGDPGTTVTLSVERTGVAEPIKFPLVRENIPIYSVKGWKRSGPSETDWDWFIDRENRIGYVRVSQFSDGVTREFDQAVREMKRSGLEGLILDLRFNPGGLLNEAVDLSNRFISEGVIVSQHNARGAAQEVQKAQRSANSLGDIPVVALINEGSASASEIVSGALQDHHRAVLVGARTFGKGSVQNVYDLGRGVAALRLTIQYYHLPGGRLIHRRPGSASWGIDPDIAVEMSPTKIGDALRIRQDADVLPIDEKGEVVLNAEGHDPTVLLSEGIDMQLESALLLLQSQSVAKRHGVAMLVPAKGVALRGGE